LRAAVKRYCASQQFAPKKHPALAPELLTARNAYVPSGHIYDFPSDGSLVVILIRPETNFSKGISGVFELLG
jgi:hypothetical protein